MLQLLDRVSRTGPRELNDDISHLLDDDIFEFIRGQVRVLWFYDSGKVIVCCQALVKKSKKIPRRDIDHAKDVRSTYLAAKQAKTLQIQREPEE